MSGICGLFNIDDAPVTDSDLRAMTAMLERRGPEKTGTWLDGPAGLGHTLLATTPELLFEPQPFVHKETGCVITADVRLDYRGELIGALDLHRSGESIGDAELILMAYLEWGEECVDRLLGDFAFAIWDPRHQMFFCARDHFGMRPLYYHHVPRRHFMFASDARAVLVLPQVPYRINEGRVADFLVPQLEWIDYTSTFFENVFRLPPGHKATVTNSGFDVVEYWRPAPGPELGPMSDDDYREGFLEVFTNSVEARLRAPRGTVGSMLSGGMDSGSVVAVAKEILRARGDGPLHTYSAVRQSNTDNPDCAESRAIHASMSMSWIAPTPVYPDALDDIIETSIVGNEEPFDGEFMFLKAIYLAAHDQGKRIVLDGAGGDIVLGEGSYIVRLIRKGQLKLALAEIAAEHRFWGVGSPVSSLFHHGRAALVPEAVKKMQRRLRQRHRAERYLKESLISPDFALSANISDRFERNRKMFPGDWISDYAYERCSQIRPNVTAGRERYGRIAAATGTEARDPFLDKRVVEYCARLPGRARLKNGWPKMILRELMSGKLPDEVLWCRGKPHLGWLINEAVTRRSVQNGNLNISELKKGLNRFVDSAALTRAWQTFRDGGDFQHIHSAYVLSAWLNAAAQRPVVLD